MSAAVVGDGGAQPRVARIEEALEELRAGRPVLVADAADRENEADVIFAASNVSVEWVAWTIRHSSGYLCAPMPATRADALALPLMVPQSQDPRRTAYTVTVDAATGVTTGISAADRRRTLAVLADPASGQGDLIRPGHVLPLRAVPGGVLHRAGHTEAAVDLVRLAGLGEVAGIAELVNDDGTMMRMDDSSALAERDGLVLITITDLITWRLAHDPSGGQEPAGSAARPRVHETDSAALPTRHGSFRVHGFRDLRTGDEHVALVPVAPSAPTTVPAVRVHSECLTGDAFGSVRCDCGPQLDAALETVAREGGAVVYLRGHEGRGIGLLAKIAAYALQDAGRDTVQANLDLGWPADRREYGAAAAILSHLGLGTVRLLTNNPAKATGLEAHGITVAERVPHQVGGTLQNAHYLLTKREQMGHLLDDATSAADTPSGTSTSTSPEAAHTTSEDPR